MILYKKILAEDVLNIVAKAVAEHLPKEQQTENIELTLSFDDDNNIEIYLLETEESDFS